MNVHLREKVHSEVKNPHRGIWNEHLSDVLNVLHFIDIKVKEQSTENMMRYANKNNMGLRSALIVFTASFLACVLCLHVLYLSIPSCKLIFFTHCGSPQ